MLEPPFPGSKAMNVVCHSESETKTVFTSKEVDNESKVVITTRELVGDKMVMVRSLGFVLLPDRCG